MITRFVKAKCLVIIFLCENLQKIVRINILNIILTLTCGPTDL